MMLGPYAEDTDHPWHRVERGEIPLSEYGGWLVAEAKARNITLPGNILHDMIPHDAMVDRAARFRADGYKTAVLTNNAKEAGENWRAIVPVDDLFDVVIDSSHVGMRKPNPAIYVHAAEQLGVAPDRCVFLDDARGQCGGGRGGRHPRHPRRPRYHARPRRARRGARMNGRAALRTVATYGLSVATPLQHGPKFFIVCPARSGSELLVQLLDSHPNIRCEGELFEDPPRQPLRFANGRAAVSHVRGADAWGCKILNHHILWAPNHFGPAPEFFRQAVDDGWRFVRLKRNDILAHALSTIQAPRVGPHYRKEDKATFERFPVDTAELITMLVTIDQYTTAIDEAIEGFVTVALTYEDDLRTPEGQQRSVDRIADALGLKPAPASSNLVAVAPPRGQDRVANWPEVAAALEHTRFRHLVT